MLNQKLTGQQAPDKTYIEDVFSTYLYTGNGSTQTINNGIDLAGKGGMVWIKNRTTIGASHVISDTNRGAGNAIFSDSATYQNYNTDRLSAFTVNGFSVGASGGVNGSAASIASWTFRKAPKFFDVVTYTGDGATSRNINHSLGVEPRFIIIKSTSTAANWGCYHYDGTTRRTALSLNTTAASGATLGSSIASATSFDVAAIYGSSFNTFNVSGQTYVAYLFAHDTTTDGLIQCGSFTTDASGNATVNLGWEPQYVMIKKTNGAGDWYLFDTMRGFSQTQVGTLLANTTAVEGSASGNYAIPEATGFSVKNSAVGTGSFVYMAIRRGPMRTPTDGTKVFSSYTASSIPAATAITTNFPVDLSIIKQRTAANDYFWFDRLRNDYYLSSNTTAAEVASNYLNFDSNTSINTAIALSSTPVLWNFKRAPGFFDVVCYTGDLTTPRAISHNLKATPELVIVKNRSAASVWCAYTASSGSSSYLLLNTTDAAASATGPWGATSPTASSFYVGASGYTNSSGANYVAYLFASCPGVSKVGTYTGNGSSQTINCDFTNGARFVLIKRTNAASHWYVFDTARGIVAGNDPVLLLNDPATENISYDQIDPDSSGFVVNYNAATNVNVNGATYIYLAIA